VWNYVRQGRPRFLGLLLVLTLIRGLIYALVIPPWQAPDETGHFEYTWLMAFLGRVPTPEDISPTFERELMASLYEWRYGELIGRPLPEGIPDRMRDLPAKVFARNSRTVLSGRFSLSYVWPALFLLPLRFQDLTFQLLIARLSSVLLNVGIVWLAYQTFSELVLSRSYLIWSMTAVVVFLPQHTFINGMVADGPLAELMACLVLYCWARLFRRGFSTWSVIGIAVGTLIGIWSKATAAFLIPLNVGLALWWFLRQPHRTWRHVAYVCVGVGLLGLAALAWDYHRSPLGSRTLGMIWESLPVQRWIWVDARGLALGEALLLSHDSFWANFGWMAVPVSPRWYGAILLMTLVAVVGWLLGGKDQEGFTQWAVIMMGGSLLMALIIFVWKGLLAPFSAYSQYQGRYLFPVVIPVAFLLIGGWMQIIPRRRQPILVMSVVLFFALFDTWSIMGYVVPYFYSH
jgi:hypothetical protein